MFFHGLVNTSLAEHASFRLSFGLGTRKNHKHDERMSPVYLLASVSRAFLSGIYTLYGSNFEDWHLHSLQIIGTDKIHGASLRPWCSPCRHWSSSPPELG